MAHLANVKTPRKYCSIW